MIKNEGKILIVDDNKDLLTALKLLLSPHFLTVTAISNPNLIPGLVGKSEFDVILLDMNFTAGIHSGNEGIYWMRKILENDPEACIVFITAYGDVELAVKSIREGAIDFIQKSWEEDKILSTILAAYKIRKSKLEIKKLKNKQKHLNEKANRQDHFCPGRSDQMKQIMETIDKVADTDANILILGENGTGKEVIAREIHNRSKRAEEIFVNVNISSLSESLFESEMFGHVKGAFTDARADRAGRFEIASGGTLFLDEIGELKKPLQTKLLAAIQNREITRVGAHNTTAVDIRLICATNQNIDKLVKEQKFREDLLYRINTIQIEIPPLRDRVDDISELVQYFVVHFGNQYQRNEIRVSQEALDHLSRQPWYGNVRELQHTIEKAVIMSDSSTLTSGNFFIKSPSASPPSDHSMFNLAEHEKRIILRALESFKGNITLTARKLGINRTTLYDKIKKYGL